MFFPLLIELKKSNTLNELIITLNNRMDIEKFNKYKIYGNLAEWLRRKIRNLLGSARAGSNPAVVEF